MPEDTPVVGTGVGTRPVSPMEPAGYTAFTDSPRVRRGTPRPDRAGFSPATHERITFSALNLALVVRNLSEMGIKSKYSHSFGV